MSTQSSSSFSNRPWKYDIFLSFSGEDTRTSFTDHLYGALNREGINTFRDNNNLVRGQDISSELLTAIQESWGSIIVFSKGYASSRWCLDELAQIVKQRKERGHQAYPLFYQIEPSDIRHQRYSVQEAFGKHKQKYKENQQKMQSWRHALTEVASLSGWTLNNQYESNFIEDIVNEIKGKLSQTCLHLKGLHSKLNIRQDDVRIVAICDAGGIGKTTLARVVYSQMSSYFEAKCFLADCDEVSQHCQLVSLQKQLLSQILPEEDFYFSNIDEGKEIISQRLPQKKVLIIMDDVNDILLLNCIVGKREWFGPGTRIIVTARYEQWIQSFRVDDICKLTTLDRAANTGRKRKINQQRIGQVLPTTTFIGEAPEALRKQIWRYLMDDGVSKIGVWGMGGVGKTAVMKLINNQLLDKNENENVIWVTVSKEVNNFKLQSSVARAMNASLSEDDHDETRRAGMLYEMFVQTGNYVLILDDLWDKISLEDVGIPEPSNGSKLVITTRVKDTCDYLGCQVVEMPTLSNEDARSLFMQKVGPDIMNDPIISPIVEKIVEQCAGLPLATVTIASSMRGVRDIFEWRNALNELTRRTKSVNKLDEKVLQKLQFSYDRLKDESIKQCFLCCALYPEDYEISTCELIRHWIAGGLVEEMDCMQEEIDKGRTIMNKLIKNCLLEYFVKNEHWFVKLHDLVRDMALCITNVRPRFLVKAGMELKEIPSMENWVEDLDKVSLMKNSGLQIPPQMQPPNCQMLTTLLLCRCAIKSIPECFFDQMWGLKILDLSHNDIQSLPNSVSNLVCLTTLFLHHCSFLENVPAFSKLQALEILSLSKTRIKSLPHGMEKLVKLKYLDLDRTMINVVPDGILSRFSRLRSFSAGYGSPIHEAFVRGKEIGGLNKLEIFVGKFINSEELNSYVQNLYGRRQGPYKYLICVGDVGEIFVDLEKYRKVIKIKDNKNGLKLPSDVERLEILCCFVELSSKESPLFSLFIPMPHGSFSNLRSIMIFEKAKGLSNMKKLFSSQYVLQNLQNLEDLYVRGCEEMEEVIASEEGIGSSYVVQQFALPKLRRLELNYLPKLMSICGANATIVCDSLECLMIDGCPNLKRIPLSIPRLEIDRLSPYLIKSIISMPREQWEKLEWDNPYTKSLLEPYTRIDGVRNPETFEREFINIKELNSYVQDLYGRTQGKDITIANCEIYTNGLELPSDVECLMLRSCFVELSSKEAPLLSLFIPMPHGSFSNLECIDINGNPGRLDTEALSNIKKLFSSQCVLQNLQNLKFLGVSHCKEMEEIIASEEGMGSNYVVQQFALPKLKILSLWNLPNLKSICGENAKIVCNSLVFFSIDDCPNLKRIPMSIPRLEIDRPPPHGTNPIIYIRKEQWEKLEWDNPGTKSLLEPYTQLLG